MATSISIRLYLVQTLGAVETEDSTFIYGAALQVRNNIACDPAFGRIKATALNGARKSSRYTFTDLTGNSTMVQHLLINRRRPSRHYLTVLYEFEG